MIKISAILAALGLGLLLLSVVPWRTPQPAASSSAPASPTAILLADAEYGKALFSAKGCMTCHRHAAVPGSGMIGDPDVPNLTNYTPNADFLRTWLKDPKAVRPQTWMPNLELKQEEIEALIAFLSAKQ
jgi:cytochrome c2